jgi:hypothetical protein
MKSTSTALTKSPTFITVNRGGNEFLQLGDQERNTLLNGICVFFLYPGVVESKCGDVILIVGLIRMK